MNKVLLVDGDHRSGFRLMGQMALVAALLFAAASCRKSGQPSDEQVAYARTAVAAIWNTLYVPADMELIAERSLYGTNPEMMPGCVRAFYLAAYRSPRAFDQLLAEYRQALEASGWEPSPYHSHSRADYDIFIMGDQNTFEVSSSPLRPDLLPLPSPSASPEQTSVVYFVQLSHFVPQMVGCRG